MMSSSENNIIVRAHVAGDIPAILGLLAESFPEHWGTYVRNGGNELAFNSDPVVAVDSKGKIVGNCGLLRIPLMLKGETITFAGIGSVAVSPDMRGKGIAGRMLEKIIETVTRENIFLNVLFTDKTNVYSKHGWQVYRQNPSLSISSSENFPFSSVEISETLPSGVLLNEVMEIYDCGYPHFDGKVVRRNQEYWRKRVALNVGDNARWLLKYEKGKPVAYGLLAGENCLCEVYSLNIKNNFFYPDILYAALKATGGHLTLSLPKYHPVLSLISEHRAIEKSPGPDVFGEELMIRQTNSERTEMSGMDASLSDNAFFWSNADKF